MIKRGEYGRDVPPSEIEYQYFMWLCEIGGFSNGFRCVPCESPNACYTHINLAGLLHDIPFRFSVPNDDNRVSDARHLRNWYAEICSDFADYTVLELRDVSVLEVLIAFAQRIDKDIMRGIEENDIDRSGFWLWLMLDNLGISDYDDDGWCYEEYQDVLYKVNIFLDREYDLLGRGGLFPLENSKNNQKTVELWYQMQEYFTANYDGLNEVFSKKDAK